MTEPNRRYSVTSSWSETTRSHDVMDMVELRSGVVGGDITVTFRLWRRPQGKVGGRYRVGPGQIEVDSVELVPFSGVTPADLCRCGEPDRETLRRRAAHSGPISDDTLLYRVEFHLVEGRRSGQEL
jgi:hypothetical protein